MPEGEELEGQIFRPPGFAGTVQAVKLLQVARNRIALDGGHHVSVA